MPIVKVVEGGMEALPPGLHKVRAHSFRVGEFDDGTKTLSLCVQDEKSRIAWCSVGRGLITSLDVAAVVGAVGVSYEDVSAQLRTIAGGGVDAIGDYVMTALADKEFWVAAWAKGEFARCVIAPPQGVYTARFLGFVPQAVYEFRQDGSPVFAPMPFEMRWRGEDDSERASAGIVALFAVVGKQFAHYPIRWRVKLTHTVKPNLWEFNTKAAIAQLGDALGVWPLLDAEAEKRPGEVLFKDERQALALFQRLAFGKMALVGVDDKGGTGYNKVMPVPVEGLPQAQEVKADDPVQAALERLARACGFAAPVDGGKLTIVGKVLLGKIVKPLVQAGHIKVSATWPVSGEVDKAAMVLNAVAALPNARELAAKDWEGLNLEEIVSGLEW